jgi:hypothetical protein
VPQGVGEVVGAAVPVLAGVDVLVVWAVGGSVPVPVKVVVVAGGTEAP